MKIGVKTIGEHVPSIEGIREYARMKLETSLKSIKQYVDEANVRIVDIGNSEKLCSIQLSIPGQIPVNVKCRDRNIYTAIAEAANRAANKGRRHIRRRRFSTSGGRLRVLRNKTDYQPKPLFASFAKE